MSKSSLIAIGVLIAFALVLMAADTAPLSPSIATILLSEPTVAAALTIPAMAAEPLAYSIREFCRDHRISIPTYYALKKQGFGPVEMRMGAIVRISREAAVAWRQARENPSEAEAEISARTAEGLRDRARRAARRAIESPLHISRRGSA